MILHFWAAGKSGVFAEENVTEHLPRLHPGRSRSNERFFKRKLSMETNWLIRTNQTSSKNLPKAYPSNPPTHSKPNKPPSFFADFFALPRLTAPKPQQTLHPSMCFFPSITHLTSPNPQPTQPYLYIPASLLRPNSAQWNILVNNVRQSLQSRPLLYAPARWAP